MPHVRYNFTSWQYEYTNAVDASGPWLLLPLTKEGTFIPTLSFGGIPATLSGFFGRYARVGRLTTVDLAITIGAKGAGVGQATIGALPFLSMTGNYPAINCSWYAGFNASVTGICGYLGDNTIFLSKPAPGSVVPLTDTDCNVGSDMILSATYNAAE